MTKEPNPAAWIGRTAARTDAIDSGRALALWATLEAGDPRPEPGSALPPLWHWLYFWDAAPRSELGPDGHPWLGGFLPELGPDSGSLRRMWAGSRVSFHSPLHLGEEARRVSTVAAVERKAGRSGPLTFVTVRHAIEGPAGLAVVEEQDLVYREAAPSAAHSRQRPPEPAPASGDRVERWTADPALLFRYSALTFNAHRIHYDAPYATAAEGWPGLVVHGPLIATLMAGAAARHRGGAALSRFAFRALRPVFVDEPFTVHVADEVGAARLWVRDRTGACAARGEAAWA